jgi:hypothetical protein
LLFPQSGKTQDPKLATARVDEKRWSTDAGGGGGGGPSAGGHG